jgi:sulfoxide reductase heme-binding subunit YedZ
VSSTIDPGQHIWWLASRSIGVVAMVLVSLSMAFGLALSGRFLHGPGVAVRTKTLHEALALSGLLAIVLHGLLLLPDPYLRPGLAGISVPFALASQPVWTAVGVVAGWLAAIVTLSFYVRRWIGVAVWRWLHRWTFAVYVMGLAHTLGSGTDAGEAWLLATLGLTTAPVLVVGTHRALPVLRGRPTRDLAA